MFSYVSTHASYKVRIVQVSTYEYLREIYTSEQILSNHQGEKGITESEKAELSERDICEFSISDGLSKNINIINKGKTRYIIIIKEEEYFFGM